MQPTVVMRATGGRGRLFTGGVMVMIHPERDTRRADLLVKIDAANQAAKRIPRHWVDSKAAIHLRLDALLDELEALDAE